MGILSRFNEGLKKTREAFRGDLNEMLGRHPDVDDGFWDDLEETLIMSDMGADVVLYIMHQLKVDSVRKGMKDASDVIDELGKLIVQQFPEQDPSFFDEDCVVLFVGVNGSGKTTTCGKIAKSAKDAGRNVILGCADTFRAAAIEQLEVWADRADVEICSRERGSDPASVSFETIERGEQIGADLVLIDTAGRLHTSADLMRELEKVVNVVRKRSNLPVKLVLVVDATTGQNGLQQAREFNEVLDLDGVIITKLDGTAKGGIAIAIGKRLGLPIVKLGVGEGLDDLKDFDAEEYTAAIIGLAEEPEPAE